MWEGTMTRFVFLALTACAHSMADDFSEDSGPQLASKDAGVHDTGALVDTWQPADTGADDVEILQPDTGTCSACDLSDPNACNGSVCGWDSQMGTSKCGYALGQGQQGAACGQMTPCAQGYVCVSPANKCMHWCKTPNGACPQNTACKIMLQMPPMACGATYAVCG
jgi:hypothetical protein